MIVIVCLAVACALAVVALANTSRCVLDAEEQHMDPYSGDPTGGRLTKDDAR